MARLRLPCTRRRRKPTKLLHQRQISKKICCNKMSALKRRKAFHSWGRLGWRRIFLARDSIFLLSSFLLLLLWKKRRMEWICCNLWNLKSLGKSTKTQWRRRRPRRTNGLTAHWKVNKLNNTSNFVSSGCWLLLFGANNIFWNRLTTHCIRLRCVCTVRYFFVPILIFVMEMNCKLKSKNNGESWLPLSTKNSWIRICSKYL